MRTSFIILGVPIIGPMIHFALRTPNPDEAEQAYLAERELDRTRAARPSGGIGMVP